MIGIALVTFVAVLAQGLRVSNSDAIERQIQADLIVTSQDGYSEFPAAVGEAVEDASVVETVSNVRQDISEIDGNGGNLTGLDEHINDVYDFRWEQGSDEAAGRSRRRRGRGAKQRGGGQQPRRRRHVPGALDGQQAEGLRRPRHLRGQPLLPAARQREHLEGRRSTSSTTGRATASRS